MCETLDIPLGGTKLSCELRAGLQTVDMAHVELGEVEPIEVTTNYVSVFNTVLPETMAQYQRADNQIGPVIKWVESGTPPSKSDLYQIRSKLTRKMLYQFDTHFKRGCTPSTLHQPGYGVSPTCPTTKIP